MSNQRYHSSYRRLLLALASLILLIFSACSLLRTKPPVRNFSTSDLLIQSLPGWGIYSGPEARSSQEFYGAVGGSAIRFMKPPNGIKQWTPTDVNNGLWEPIADMEQWIVQFQFIEDAAGAFNDHYLSSAIQGQPLTGFNYASPIAKQFRVVCDVGPESEKTTDCFMEGQYDEFYTIMHYQSSNSSNAVGDLKAIARAIDQKMLQYLGAKK